MDCAVAPCLFCCCFSPQLLLCARSEMRNLGPCQLFFFFKADKKRETLHTPETSNPMTVSCVSVYVKKGRGEERRMEGGGEERRGEERRGEEWR